MLIAGFRHCRTGFVLLNFLPVKVKKRTKSLFSCRGTDCFYSGGGRRAVTAPVMSSYDRIKMDGHFNKVSPSFIVFLYNNFILFFSY
jgi:hypothetical protein